MTGALKAVADGLLGVNKAADEFSVPRSTLKDRLSGKVVHGARSGPTPYLSGKRKTNLLSFCYLLPISVCQRRGSRSLTLCGRR